MKVLNLYAGIGGNRAAWPDHADVVAVELNPAVAEAYKRNFPCDDVIVADAHAYLEKHYDKFDAIWASPPCQTHSRMPVQKARYPDLSLYEEILFLKYKFKGNWIVENVRPFYKALVPGSYVGRHMIWSNRWIPPWSPGRPNINIMEATKAELESYLRLPCPDNLYLNGNHDPLQVMRNCVDPELGRFLFDRVFRPRSDDELDVFNAELSRHFDDQLDWMRSAERDDA